MIQQRLWKKIGRESSKSLEKHDFRQNTGKIQKSQPKLFNNEPQKQQNKIVSNQETFEMTELGSFQKLPPLKIGKGKHQYLSIVEPLQDVDDEIGKNQKQFPLINSSLWINQSENSRVNVLRKSKLQKMSLNLRECKIVLGGIRSELLNSQTKFKKSFEQNYLDYKQIWSEEKGMKKNHQEEKIKIKYQKSLYQMMEVIQSRTDEISQMASQHEAMKKQLSQMRLKINLLNQNIEQLNNTNANLFKINQQNNQKLAKINIELHFKNKKIEECSKYIQLLKEGQSNDMGNCKKQLRKHLKVSELNSNKQINNLKIINPRHSVEVKLKKSETTDRRVNSDGRSRTYTQSAVLNLKASYQSNKQMQKSIKSVHHHHHLTTLRKSITNKSMQQICLIQNRLHRIKNEIKQEIKSAKHHLS